jgi:predicted flap endonuclease-1-like 5' DNA nuclease
MRSDYALYTVAVIFFILTALVLAVQVEYREVWTVITVVLGLLFIGLGYSQRPKLEEAAFEQMPFTPTEVTETVEEEIPVDEETAPPQPLGLTQLRGIGEKRSEQLKAAGINDVEDLAKASAKNLATKLNISPKITRRWVRNAKKLAGNS